MIEIPLSSTKYPGLVALVDDEDVEPVAGYSWIPLKGKTTFYAQAHVPGTGHNGKKILMHRLIRPEIKGTVDHADRNGLNNTRANLRPATGTQQIANQGIRRTNTSGYKGVSWKKDKGKWRARTAIDGKLRFLGYFDDPADAARAYDAAAREHFGEFAVLNFPEAA